MEENFFEYYEFVFFLFAGIILTIIKFLPLMFLLVVFVFLLAVIPGGVGGTALEISGAIIPIIKFIVMF